jgi:hypothetical protein
VGRLDEVEQVWMVGSAERIDSAGFDLIEPVYFGLLQNVQREESRAAGHAVRYPLQGCLALVGRWLPGEQELAEQVELDLVVPVMPAVPARISMFSRLNLPAVPGGIPTPQNQSRLVVPEPVEPANI